MPLIHALARVAAAFVILVAGFAVLQGVVPARDGPLELGRIVLPHLVLLGLAGLPLVAWRGPRTARAAAVVMVAMAGVQLGPDWVSLPAAASASRPGAPTTLTVVSWNLELGSRAAADSVTGILAHPADVVALQELTPDVAAAIDASEGLVARYPYRRLDPDPGVAGQGLLSRFPIVSARYAQQPVLQEATLDLGERHLRVLNVHPFPSRVEWIGPLPIGYDPSVRDAGLTLIGDLARAAPGRPVADLVIGDLNTTPTEPAFRLALGDHRDVHGEVGTGPGWTWRPSRFEGLGIGLFRIDVVFVGPGLVPGAAATDCSRTGDHCLVIAEVGLPAP